jgi:hypothetical protein
LAVEEWDVLRTFGTVSRGSGSAGCSGSGGGGGCSGGGGVSHVVVVVVGSGAEGLACLFSERELRV